MRFETSDVVVIGGGAAGVFASIAAAKGGAKVILLTGRSFGYSGSSFTPLSMGWGISAATGYQDRTDSPKVHFSDIETAAAGMFIPELAEILVNEAPDFVEELKDMGIPLRPVEICTCFNTKPRAFRAYDVSAVRAVFGQQLHTRGIQVIDNCRALDLLVDDEGYRGVIAKQYGSASGNQAEHILISSSTCILASGGAGGMFKYNLTTGEVMGDGHAMALRAGARLTNFEFIQFAFGVTSPMLKALFPEAFFAYCPRLINSEGVDIAAKYFTPQEYASLCEQRATHAPYTSRFDSCAIDRAIYKEIIDGRARPGGGILVDLSVRSKSELESGRLGHWVEWYKNRGVDIYYEGVEIAPFVQAFNGGILINQKGETDVKRLYACGEIAAGPHGADRVGGNMMATTMVFGTRAGKHAAELASTDKRVMSENDAKRLIGGEHTQSTGRLDYDKEILQIKQAMYDYCGIERDAKHLQAAEEALTKMYEGLPVGQGFELGNCITTARAVIASALAREESRGSHYRSDYPHPDDSEFGRRIETRMDRESGQLICKLSENPPNNP